MSNLMQYRKWFGYIFLGLGVALAWTNAEFLSGSLVIIGGILIYLQWRSKRKIRVKESASVEFFPAWHNDHPGVDNIIKEIKSEYKPYYGKTEDQIVRYMKEKGRNTLYEYPRKTIHDLMFVADPTNKYNPNAIKIISEKYGAIGYISDSDIDTFKSLSHYPREFFKLVISGGNKMMLMDDQLVLDKNNPRVMIYFDQ